MPRDLLPGTEPDSYDHMVGFNGGGVTTRMRRKLVTHGPAQVGIGDVPGFAARSGLDIARRRRFSAQKAAPICTDHEGAVRPITFVRVAGISAAGRRACRYRCDRVRIGTGRSVVRVPTYVAVALECVGFSFGPQVSIAVQLIETPLRKTRGAVAPSGRPRGPEQTLDNEGLGRGRCSFDFGHRTFYRSEGGRRFRATGYRRGRDGGGRRRSGRSRVGSTRCHV